MLKDITLGQYYQEDSLIHRLDPRVKLIGTVVFMISLFLFNNFIFSPSSDSRTALIIFYLHASYLLFFLRMIIGLFEIFPEIVAHLYSDSV